MIQYNPLDEWVMLLLSAAREVESREQQLANMQRREDLSGHRAAWGVQLTELLEAAKSFRAKSQDLAEQMRSFAEQMSEIDRALSEGLGEGGR